jgi:hypothetical protein
VTFGAASGEQGEQGRPRRISSTEVRLSEGQRRRARRLISLLLVIAGTSALSAPAAFADSKPGSKPVRPDLRPLWSSFPLRQTKQPPRPSNTVPQSAQLPTTPARAGSADSGWSALGVALIVAAAIVVVGLVALGASLLRRRQSRLRRAGAGDAHTLQFPLTRGGPTVTYLRRKLRPRRGGDASTPESQEAQPADATRARERLVAYSMRDELAAREGGTEAPAEPAAEEEAERIEPESPADLASVGKQVDTVLKSAQEAAARIRRAAEQDAERVRKEAEDAAAAVVADARRDVEADRAEAGRARAEAEAYAKDTREASDAYAEQRRSGAEREAAQVAASAQKRLADAEDEVQRKMREATAEERQRIKELQAEVARYEERLDGILVVFRGVTSQLENLLAEREASRGGRLDVSDEALEEALSPNRSGSRIG